MPWYDQAHPKAVALPGPKNDVGGDVVPHLRLQLKFVTGFYLRVLLVLRGFDDSM